MNKYLKEINTYLKEIIKYFKEFNTNHKNIILFFILLFLLLFIIKQSNRRTVKVGILFTQSGGPMASNERRLYDIVNETIDLYNNLQNKYCPIYKKKNLL